MKTLTKYLLLEFLKLLAIAVAGFVMVFLLVDLFENMGNLMKNNVPFSAAAAFFIYKIPFIISQIIPVAVLLAVLLTLGILSKHNEITAIKAGGVRLLSVLKPLFVTGAVISVAVLALNETVTTPALRKTEEFKRTWFGSKMRTFGAEGMWIRTNSGIINVKYFDIRAGEMRGVVMYEVESPFAVKSRVHAKKLLWQGGKWVATDAVAWTFTKDGQLTKTTSKNVVFNGLDAPQDLAGADDAQKNMTAGELGRYIKNLEAEGYMTGKYKTDLYGRFTFPLVSFIMVILGIPFALKTGRTGGIAVGVGLSVVIAFSYWIVFAASRSLGVNGVVPPIVAAAFPDMLFFAAGALMLGSVKE